MTYDQIGALNGRIATLLATLANYHRAVANYEKAIKRLRKGVWSGQQAKARVRTLENYILRASCDRDLDACARGCDPGQYQIHAEARDLRMRRGHHVAGRLSVR